MRDVDEAIDHYCREAGDKTALRFVDRIESVYRRIAMHPLSGSPRYAYELALPDLRYAKVPHFPYLVFYVDTPDHIDVWRILHAARDIPSWLQDDESHT